MAHLLRLIAFVLLSLAGSAHALVPFTSDYYISVSAGYFGTPAAACQGNMSTVWTDPVVLARWTYASVSGSDASGWTCRFEGNANTGYAVYTPTVNKRSGVCPANSAASGSACACSAGYVEDAAHAACVGAPSALEQFCKDAVAYKNSFNQSGTIGSTSALPSVSCYKPDPPFPGVDAAKGCAMKLGDGMAVPRDGNPLLRDWSATGVPTGATCEDAAATDAAPKSTPNPCPDGFAGTVNGSTVCVKREPDKGIEGVKGTEVKAADGTSTITKETTKCEGGQCTTTKETTTKDSTGAQVGTVKVEETKEGIGSKCAKDPGNKVCAAVGMGEGEGGASFTGDCAAGFKVNGEDPILNAMALEQYKRNCQVFATDKAESVVVANASDPSGLQKATTAGDSTVAISSGNFDTSNSLGGGGCSLNKTITVAHMTATLPFNVICDPLAYLGQVLVAVSLLLAARIVARG